MSDKMTAYKEGMALFSEAKHADSIEKFKAALAIDPEWDDCMQALAMAQMHAGDLKAALETAKQICELTPTDPLAFTGLSMIYQRMDRIDDAETAQSRARMLSWKQELKTNPDAPPPTDMNVIQ